MCSSFCAFQCNIAVIQLKSSRGIKRPGKRHPQRHCIVVNKLRKEHSLFYSVGFDFYAEQSKLYIKEKGITEMKNLLTFNLILFAAAVFASPVIYRDSTGRVTGSATTNGSITTYRDGSGKLTGSSTQSGNRITYRDQSGRVVGSAERNGSHIIYRDKRGRMTGGATINGDRTTYLDRQGRIMGSAAPSGSQTTYRDGSGKLKGTVSCGADSELARDAFFRVETQEKKDRR